MNIFRNTFDFFFPLMPKEEETPEPRKDIQVDDVKGDTNTLKEKVQSAKCYYEEENERNRIIEGKASMFITSSGFLGTILIGTSNILVNQEGGLVPFKILMIVCLLLFAIYMVKTIIFSVKTLTRTKFYRPDPGTLLQEADKDKFIQQLIADYVNSTTNNQEATNLKMDNVVMAQHYFKRLMWSVLLFVIVLLLYVLEKNDISVVSWLQSLNQQLATWTFSFWYMLLSSLLILVSLVVGITALVKISRLRKTEIES